MASGQRIEALRLTKRYGSTIAVDGLSSEDSPGLVTGFIGPNVASTTTTMWLILGPGHPSGGAATVGGRAYRYLPAPLREVGALIDAKLIHPSLTADG